MSRLTEAWPLGPEFADAAVERAGQMIALAAGLTLAAVLVAGTLVNVTMSVDASGWIESSAIYSLRAPSDGIVSKVLVTTGQVVDSGAVVAYLDDPVSDAELRRLRASLAENRITQAREVALSRIAIRHAEELRAQADLRSAQARIELSRMEIEYGTPAGPKTDTAPNLAVDAARVTVALADAESRSASLELQRALADTLRNVEWMARISKLTADVRRLEREAQWRVVRAPAQGMVLTSDVQDLVGQPVQRGEPLVDIADGRGWRAKLLLEERDASQVMRGQTVRLRLVASDPLVDPDLTGIIEGVEGPALTDVDPGTAGNGSRSMIRVAVKVLDSTEEPAAWVKNGMSVQATIITGRDRLLWRFVRDIVGSVPKI